MPDDQLESARWKQPDAWGGLQLDPQIQQKATAFLQMIPGDVGRVLDVGCGDGAITNRVGESFEIVGVDASAEALRHLDGEAHQSRAEDLSFPDGSFDLVMSSQMLEHLNDDSYAQALDHIRRIARRYVLISVPYREDLRLRDIRCPRCGWVGHVWGHRRSFTIESLLHDLDGFEVREVRLLGRLQEPPWPRWMLWPSQKLLRAYYNPDGQSPLCERCGNTDWSGARPLRGWGAKRRIDRFRRRPALPFWLAVLAERQG